MPEPKKLYDDKFFAGHSDNSRQSARSTLPVLFKYVQPKSVVDIGCGNGTWLVEFKAQGVHDYLGVDGDYVNRAKLLIEPDRFMAHDLERPFRCDRQFDLAVSVEVAEHLHPEYAPNLVDTLVRLSCVVLFSAAIPHQGGTGHFNEQWPEYWQDLFAQHNFVPIDCIRWELWYNRDVSVWYRQNLMLFANRARLGEHPALAKEFEKMGVSRPLSFVHPAHYIAYRDTLIGDVLEHPKNALYSLLKLRAVNLVAFPDWSQPESTLRSEIGNLLSALHVHPDRRHLALVVNLPQQDDARAMALLEGLTSSLGLDSPSAERAQLVALGPLFGPRRLQLLLESLHGRIPMPHDDMSAVAAKGGLQLPLLPLSAILERRQIVRQ